MSFKPHAHFATEPLQVVLTGALLFGLALSCAGCGGAGANEGGQQGGNQEDTTAPSAPSGLKGNSENSAVELSWNAVGADDLGGYNVYRSTSTIESTSDMQPKNGSLLDSLSYTDDTAENGTTYHYRVTAVDTSSNESDPSSEVEKTPFDDPPSRP